MVITRSDILKSTFNGMSPYIPMLKSTQLGIVKVSIAPTKQPETVSSKSVNNVSSGSVTRSIFKEARSNFYELGLMFTSLFNSYTLVDPLPKDASPIDLITLNINNVFSGLILDRELIKLRKLLNAKKSDPAKLCLEFYKELLNIRQHAVAGKGCNNLIAFVNRSLSAIHRTLLYYNDEFRVGYESALRNNTHEILQNKKIYQDADVEALFPETGEDYILNVTTFTKYRNNKRLKIFAFLMSRVVTEAPIDYKALGMLLAGIDIESAICKSKTNNSVIDGYDERHNLVMSGLTNEEQEQIKKIKHKIETITNDPSMSKPFHFIQGDYLSVVASTAEPKGYCNYISNALIAELEKIDHFTIEEDRDELRVIALKKFKNILKITRDLVYKEPILAHHINYKLSELNGELQNVFHVKKVIEFFGTKLYCNGYNSFLKAIKQCKCVIKVCLGQYDASSPHVIVLVPIILEGKSIYGYFDSNIGLSFAYGDDDLEMHIRISLNVISKTLGTEELKLEDFYFSIYVNSIGVDHPFVVKEHRYQDFIHDVNCGKLENWVHISKLVTNDEWIKVFPGYRTRKTEFNPKMSVIENDERRQYTSYDEWRYSFNCFTGYVKGSK